MHAQKACWFDMWFKRWNRKITNTSIQFKVKERRKTFLCQRRKRKDNKNAPHQLAYHHVHYGIRKIDFILPIDSLINLKRTSKINEFNRKIQRPQPRTPFFPQERRLEWGMWALFCVIPFHLIYTLFISCIIFSEKKKQNSVWNWRTNYPSRDLRHLEQHQAQKWPQNSPQILH
jgi:hypothetical protein